MKLNHKPLSPARIEVMPLIDVVFLLLVFFIYAMLSMAVHYGQVVDLPSSSSATLEIQEAISVTIQDNNSEVLIFIGEESVSLARLVERLHDIKLKTMGTKEPEVQIFADKSVSYQELFKVMDCVKEAGLSKISLQAVAAKQGFESPDAVNP
ncbi:MAG: biopolymer transporter ExbD [Desulfocapsa sp.]|nr:biopolymer transporter ExbD [Desulfocapsa sp.]